MKYLWFAGVPVFWTAYEEPMYNEIDWKSVRARIAVTAPVAVKRPPKKRRPMSAEELEEYRRKGRERNKAWRDANPERNHAREKAWRDANPEKVRAKKRRFYEKHKLDPAWMERHREKNRAYKLRKRINYPRAKDP